MHSTAGWDRQATRLCFSLVRYYSNNRPVFLSLPPLRQFRRSTTAKVYPLIHSTYQTRSRAEQSRAEQSRAEQNRAEQAKPGRLFLIVRQALPSTQTATYIHTYIHTYIPLTLVVEPLGEQNKASHRHRAGVECVSFCHHHHQQQQQTTHTRPLTHSLSKSWPRPRPCLFYLSFFQHLVLLYWYICGNICATVSTFQQLLMAGTLLRIAG